MLNTINYKFTINALTRAENCEKKVIPFPWRDDSEFIEKNIPM